MMTCVFAEPASSCRRLSPAASLYPGPSYNFVQPLQAARLLPRVSWPQVRCCGPSNAQGANPGRACMSKAEVARVLWSSLRKSQQINATTGFLITPPRSHHYFMASNRPAGSPEHTDKQPPSVTWPPRRCPSWPPSPGAR